MCPAPRRQVALPACRGRPNLAISSHDPSSRSSVVRDGGNHRSHCAASPGCPGQPVRRIRAAILRPQTGHVLPEPRWRPVPVHPLSDHGRRQLRELRQQLPHPRLERSERRRDRLLSYLSGSADPAHGPPLTWQYPAAAPREYALTVTVDQIYGCRSSEWRYWIRNTG